MTLREIMTILDAEKICNGTSLDTEVGMACGSDLMSDVLAFAKPRALLLTGLSTLQTIYTAEMADIHLICFVRGKKPQEKMVELAEQRRMTILTTDLPMFESCGRLYRGGLKGCTET